jgi:nitroreductase
MDIKAFYKAVKTLIRLCSVKKASFIYQERRMDVSNLDDDLLMAQIGYFGHHLEKALKHHNRGTRGKFKRDKLEILLNEYGKRKNSDRVVLNWAEKLITYYDNNSEIYLESYEPAHKNDEYSDVVDFIRARKSVRFWEAREVPDDILNEILETSLSASLSCNRQSIRFAVEKNRVENMDIGDSNNLSIFGKAPVLIYVADDSRFFSEKYGNALDVGAVCATLQLAAKARNLASVWIYYSESYEQSDTKKRLGFKDYHYIYSVIALGYPLDNQEKPPRFDTENFIVKKIVK